jgi:hypothetical protein
MTEPRERRRAPRIPVSISCKIVIPQTTAEWGTKDRELGIESVHLPQELAGRELGGTIVDLSESGIRIIAQPIPMLLTRMEVSFVLEGFGPAAVTGLVMWRNRVTFPVKMPDGRTLNPSFGLLFEFASIELRQALASDAVTRGLGNARQPVPW